MREEALMKRIFALARTSWFCGIAFSDYHNSAYLVDFKCDAAACKGFASMTMEELNTQVKLPLKSRDVTI